MIKQGNFINVHGKVAIVVSRFNETITKNLVDGATSTLKKFGIKDEDIDIYWVPGAFEIGFTAKKVLETNKYTGIMTLGAVIKGETDQIPITFGMLTTENIEQALQRAGLKAGNEGSATAQSLLEMMSLNEQITK